jgi:hypothetical protein
MRVTKRVAGLKKSSSVASSLRPSREQGQGKGAALGGIAAPVATLGASGWRTFFDVAGHALAGDASHAPAIIDIIKIASTR